MTATASSGRSGFAALRARRWFDSGWCAAAATEILSHPGSDTAKVRRALRTLTERGITDRAARRSYALGVRAKLAKYREQGLI
jgi:DNA-binding IclR family transcriptional regulator